MNNQNKNIQPLIELPESLKQLPAEAAVDESVELITIPEHLAPVREETAHELGSTALAGGRFNNGTIPLSPDEVGPRAIRESGALIAPDTYVIPNMRSDREQ